MRGASRSDGEAAVAGSAGPPLEYRAAPVLGRIRLEPAKNGSTIFMPPVGMWRRSRWGLLAVLLLIVVPAAGLAVIDPSLVRSVPYLIGVAARDPGTNGRAAPKPL